LNEARPTIRLDKWLWQARFFKSRSLAAGVVTAGKVSVNSQPAGKPARAVGAGDMLTFVQEKETRVVRIVACGVRRGPAPEAQALYDDLTPAPKVRPVEARGANPKYEKGGRPTKKDRRDMRLDWPD
jgi:ribosome-associated heat shock protein Hsp15